jgi:serine/threonine protein kinase
MTSAASTNPRWQAPEIIREKPLSRESDIWSLAMTFLELLTRHQPYSNIVHDFNVGGEVKKYKTPQRPKDQAAIDAGLNDELWELVKQCWKKPEDRPTVEDVKLSLARIRGEIAGGKSIRSYPFRLVVDVHQTPGPQKDGCRPCSRSLANIRERTARAPPGPAPLLREVAVAAPQNPPVLRHPSPVCLSKVSSSRTIPNPETLPFPPLFMRVHLRQTHGRHTHPDLHILPFPHIPQFNLTADRHMPVKPRYLRHCPTFSVPPFNQTVAPRTPAKHNQLRASSTPEHR